MRRRAADRRRHDRDLGDRRHLRLEHVAGLRAAVLQRHDRVQVHDRDAVARLDVTRQRDELAFLVDRDPAERSARRITETEQRRREAAETRDVARSDVVLDGEAQLKETSVKQLQHYAKDAGKSKEEIAKITEPKKEVIFVAKGVLVL